MKILAVIPARAGSKGIPNKNIRILAGRPMVWYAIRNALASTWITDIVVSTDSPGVKVIAQQMGVVCHWRDSSLSGDDVTLDAVIYDAIPEGEWDYIVTMQPTSPTLKVTTLDKAIEYCIQHDIDTLISAINSPHLAWIEKDGQKVPAYSARLNRQYLPPHYKETGAFVVSKAAVVTPSTRIGRKVDTYEVSESEAQDVDTFDDLRNVAAVLSPQKVAIYVNGNNKRGTGHISRVLEIADEFYTKPDIFYDSNQTDPQIFNKTTHNLIAVNGVVELYKICRKEQYTLFINDILSTSIEYMIGLRTVLPDAKIVNFEDDGEGGMNADIVINAMYSSSEFHHVKAGARYYIPEKIFMFYDPIEINEYVKRVFISFGGNDTQNYSDRILSIICSEEYRDLEFIVVLGKSKRNVLELFKYNEYANIEVLQDVPNMPELMTSCDIAITSRGRTGYELALLGIPTICMAQNKQEEKHTFMSNENGFTYIGLNPDDEIIEDTLRMYLKTRRNVRQKFQDTLLGQDLRSGMKRVIALLNM